MKYWDWPHYCWQPHKFCKNSMFCVRWREVLDVVCFFYLCYSNCGGSEGTLISVLFFFSFFGFLK